MQNCDRGSRRLTAASDMALLRDEVLTFLRHSLGLRTLDALVFCPSVAGGVHCDAGVGVALERHDVVLARDFASKLVCNSRHTASRVRTHTHAQCIYAYVYSTVSNVHTITCHEGPERGRGVALLFLQPRRLIRVDGQRHALAALPPDKRPSTQYKRLGGPQDRSGPPPGCRISYAL